MSVRIEGETAWLEGDSAVEDAEPLAAALESGAIRAVELSGALGLHGAVVQAILHFKPAIRGAPQEPFLHSLVAPALVAAGAAASDPSTESDV